MNLILAFFISNILGVIYDYLYKIIFPYNITKHKFYVNNLRDTITQILFNTLVSAVLGLRAGFKTLRIGINYYRMVILIRGIIHVVIFMTVYAYLLEEYS